VLLLEEGVHICFSEEWDMSLQGWLKLHPLQGTPLIFRVIFLELHRRTQLENKEKTDNRRALKK